MSNQSNHPQGRRPEEERPEDIEYGDFEDAEAEDEAPEAVQAMSSGPGPWATFPDLLRVQSSNVSGPVEDDSPESMGFAGRQPQPAAANSSGPSSSSSSSAILEPRTGAIAKSRPLAPPDVSQTSANNSKLSGQSQRSGGPSDLLDLCNIPASSVAGRSSRTPNAFGVRADAPGDRLSSLEREVTSLQAQRAALQQQIHQKDAQLRDSRQPSLHRASNVEQQNSNSTLTSLAETVARVEFALDKLSKQMNGQLGALELKLNQISLNSTQVLNRPSGAAAAAVGGAEEGQPLAEIGSIRDELRRFSEQQRRDLIAERTSLLLNFAEVFRGAAETKNSNTDENTESGARNRDMNGPH